MKDWFNEIYNIDNEDIPTLASQKSIQVKTCKDLIEETEAKGKLRFLEDKESFDIIKNIKPKL